MASRPASWLRLAAAVVSALLMPAAAVASNCQNTSTGRLPLTDLGAGLYLNQFPRGLYPGGANTLPPAHTVAGLAAAAQIVPRDMSGAPDASHGKVVLLSLGMSNTTAEFCIPGSGTTGCAPQSFMGQAADNLGVNHTTLAIVNGARGGQDASTWLDAAGPNYVAVAGLFAGQGLSEAQVQAVWVKEADAGPTMALPAATADAYALEGRLAGIARALKVRYPNVQQVFFSSRIYAGYASTTLNPEPYAYESAFAVKWLVEAQIIQMATPGHPPDPRAGDLEYGAVAPWIAWGPYLWADGTTARSDGLTWVCADLQSDGTHPAIAGIQKVGSLLLDFFLTSPVTQSWFPAAGQSTTTTTTSSTPTTTVFGCAVAPGSACQAAAPVGARISLRRGATAEKNMLTWKWLGTGATMTADFGSPTTTTGYALCLYDASGLRLAAAAPAGGTCGTKSCWTEVTSGFRYSDAELTPDGLRKVTLTAGGAGAGGLAVRGKGMQLTVPTPPLAVPVRVQARRSDKSMCWEATFSGTPTRNDAQRFQARSD